MAEKPEQEPGSGRFLPGNTGGAGRPKGARNKLGEAFLKALSTDFDEHGIDAIKTVREEDPSTYVKVVASLLPKEMKLEGDGEGGAILTEIAVTFVRPNGD